MKKLFTLTLSLLMLLSLTACNSDVEAEPPLQTTVEGEESLQSPFADTNTSKRYYFAQSGLFTNGVVYGDNYYCTSGNLSIVAVPLSEAVKHNILEEGNATPIDVTTSLCFDPLCDHSTDACPAMMRSYGAEFLIDVAESNGEFPVIYYHRSTGEIWDEDGSITSMGNEIIRFDVAKGEAKRVIFSNEPIKQLMAYGDYLYYTTMSSDDEMNVHTVKKTGEDAHHLATGATAIKLIGANEQGAYFNDDKGNVYALALSGESFEKIYTLREYYVLGHPGTGAAELNMMVYEEYLYYFADYKVVELPWFTGTENFSDHSIRRVKLDALDVPSTEGEMVAESVYERCFFGIYNGVLYYSPFDVSTNLDNINACTYSQSNGTINGVDLKTLEIFTVISDCGFNFMGESYYVSDRCIIGTMHPYRDISAYSVNTKFWGRMLLDFESGAVYCVEGRA